ncbi:MAG: FecR domain-containing protein [Spirochaetales bacterium]|nr:FecR domain-containing protein [Spirochaetales bacterium]
MKSIKTLTYIFLLSTLFCFAIGAEEVELLYADDLYELEAFDSEGNEIYPEIGLLISEGWTVKTGQTGAEFQYTESSSILRLSENSLFKIDGLRNTANPEAVNRSTLFNGKIRVVAARVRGNRFSLRTPSSGFGVRGTDFLVTTETDPESENSSLDSLTVFEGKVESWDFETEEARIVEAGEQLSRARMGLILSALEETELITLSEETSFTVLDPMSVPHEEEYTPVFDLKEQWPEEPEGDGTSLEREVSSDSSEHARATENSTGTSVKGLGSGRNGINIGSSENRGDRADTSQQTTDSEKSSVSITQSGMAGSKLKFRADAFTGYSIFSGDKFTAISDGGFTIGISVGSRLVNAYWLDTKLNLGVTMGNPKFTAVKSVLATPMGLSVGARLPITDLFYAGLQAEGGFNLLRIMYIEETGWDDDLGFTPYGSLQAVAGITIKTFAIELKSGLTSFQDGDLNSMIPITLSVGFGS